MDKLTYIRKILKKFYEGNSSLEEEKELIEFFSENAVPDDLQADKEMFTSMIHLSEPVEIPDGLDERITKRLAKEEQNETRGRRITLFSLSGLAAGIIIILSVYMGFIRNGNQQGQLAQYTIEDPELAYEEIRKTLSFVSEKWNEGTGELQSLENISSGMKSISPLRKISSGSKELNLLGNLRRADEIKAQ
ncbi:MAG: hypothetical protein K9J30_03805 [Bacteroidales bacterium]|nr:hypothetical protein [Bacteroidales bacterium]